MERLGLPISGRVYLDTSPVIYSIEKIEPYWAILYPVWASAQVGRLTLIGSELLLLETLVKPLREGDTILANSFQQLLESPQVHLEPISRKVLERAAQLRAQTSIKTPDAIHAATCLLVECDYLLTNDPAFTRVPGITTIVLRDFLPGLGS